MLSLHFATNIITYVNWKVSLDYVSWQMDIWKFEHTMWYE